MPRRWEHLKVVRTILPTRSEARISERWAKNSKNYPQTQPTEKYVKLAFDAAGRLSFCDT